MERILNMILRRLIGKGINSGFKAVSNLGSKKNEQNPQESKQNPQNVRGLRKATGMMRRMTKL